MDEMEHNEVTADTRTAPAWLTPTRRGAFGVLLGVITQFCGGAIPTEGKRHKRKRKRKKKVTLCLDYQTLTVSKKQQQGYLNEGATAGACTCLPPTQDLRAAIDAAAPGATLELCPGTWTLTRPPGDANYGVTFPRNISLIGAGSGRTIVTGNKSGGGAVAGFRIPLGITIHIEALTIQEFWYAGNLSGALANEGTLSLTNVVIDRNDVGDNGTVGGIYNTGSLSMQGCTLSRNSAEATGALVNLGPATLRGCRVVDNGAGGPGGSSSGGISNGSSLTLIDTLVSGNRAHLGSAGGISNNGMLTLERSQVTQNQTDDNGQPIPTVSGGINNSNGGAVVLKDGSSVTDNSPNNCAGSDSPVAGCID